MQISDQMRRMWELAKEVAARRRNVPPSPPKPKQA